MATALKKFILYILRKMFGKYFWFARLEALIETYTFNVAFIERGVHSYFGKVLKGTIIADGIYELAHIFVKKYLEQLLGRSLEITDLQKEKILRIFGEAVADGMRDELAKQNISFPIQSVYPVDEFTSNLGVWLANEVNIKTGHVIFTTFIPFENVQNEIDVFICNEIGLKTGIYLDTIFSADAIQIFKEQALNLIQDEINAHLTSIVSNASILSVADVEQYSNTSFSRIVADENGNTVVEYWAAGNQEELRQVHMMLLNRVKSMLQEFVNQMNLSLNNRLKNKYGVTTKVLNSGAMLYNSNYVKDGESFEIAGIYKPVKGVSSKITKQKNRARQARFRLTHREQRIWVSK